MNTTSDTKIKAYKPKELANFYGVTIKTLRTWLLPHQQDVGERSSKYYTAKQVRIIFEKLGEPG
jgi:DNA-binding transcriptional MerR regulator